MEQFIDKSTHSGNPQDEYNKIQSGYPLEHLKNEAAYILEEQADGTFSLTKKPEDCKLESVTNIDVILRDNSKEKVLVLYVDGRFHRFNFDFKSQFPREDEPDTTADGTPTEIEVGVPTGMTATPAKVAPGKVTSITLDKGTASALPTGVTVTVDGSAVGTAQCTYTASTGVITLTDVTVSESITIAAAT